MPYDPDKHQRRSIRLRDYDYAQPGAYFVTICTNKRECLFGEVTDGEMNVNTMGCIVEEEWLRTARLRPYVQLDVFVVMPNHFHGIVMIIEDETIRARHGGSSRAAFGKPPARSVSSIVGSFKSAVTKKINRLRDTLGATLWQRNYYEHIIRDDADLQRIREYIVGNPGMWIEDRYHPDNTDLAKR